MAVEKKAKKNAKAGRATENGALKALRRPLLISVGALSLAQEQVSELLNSLSKRGHKAQKASREYLEKLMENGSDIVKKIEKQADKVEKKAEVRGDLIPRVLHLLNLPTREDIIALDKKVEALLKKVA